MGSGNCGVRFLNILHKVEKAMCDLTIKDLVDELADHFADGLAEADQRCREEATDQEDYNKRFKDYLRAPIEAMAVRCYGMGSEHANGDSRQLASQVKISEQYNPEYRWRPATKGDIGSVARFGDTLGRHEPWTYGILNGIELNRDQEFEFLCDDGNLENSGETLRYFVCQIQYDANQEP